MELIDDWLQQPAGARPRTVFSIGVFDGLHLGHKALLDTVIKSAARHRAQSLILTFSRHPLTVLAPAAAPPTLTTLAQKAEVMAAWGLDRLGVLHFTKEMAATPPRKFLFQFLGKFIEPAAVILGPDFTFGQGAKGEAGTVAAWLAQVSPRAKVTVIPSLAGPDGLYSSSQIRQSLKSGLVESAARALGRPYRLSGLVMHGQARGRILGFPTANLGHIGQIIPAPGVYAVRVILGGETLGGMTSIGFNPTFNTGQAEAQPLTVETHIFDFDRFIYGQTLSLDFIAHLRDMVRFKSAEQLAGQLDKDRRSALAAL
ncbi:MAG: riboflavin biosynthesis protein RibF [Candidatus Adiutrix sp.]|jgi:riboflavin kinase/FMN adenylyltransferase|nr:riboflavin biosynthesis protein RibF [Candidatus Adiutrix sp.]